MATWPLEQKLCCNNWCHCRRELVQSAVVLLACVGGHQKRVYCVSVTSDKKWGKKCRHNASFNIFCKWIKFFHTDLMRIEKIIYGKNIWFMMWYLKPDLHYRSSCPIRIHCFDTIFTCAWHYILWTPVTTHMHEDPKHSVVKEKKNKSCNDTQQAQAHNVPVGQIPHISKICDEALHYYFLKGLFESM